MLTEKDYNRAHRENAKNHYGFTRQQLTRLVYAHKNGTPHRKEYIEQRLTDCNFHYECGLLMHGKYKQCLQEIRNW